MTDDIMSPKRNRLYKEQFDILSFHTTEYDDMLGFLRTEIFPKLPAMEHFLDIGAGRGNYARPFSQEFKHTTIVEPNEVYFKEILAWASENGSQIEGYNCEWQSVDFRARVDLILMSHMLYYVPKNERMKLIRKAYNQLKQGGYLVIVLNSEGCGIREVYEAFYPEHLYEAMPTGEEIAAMMRDEGYQEVVEQIFPAKITVPTMEDLYLLIDFLLLRKIPFDTDEMIVRRQRFVEDFLIRDGELVVDSEGTIVIVKKPHQ